MLIRKVVSSTAGVSERKQQISNFRGVQITIFAVLRHCSSLFECISTIFRIEYSSEMLTLFWMVNLTGNRNQFLGRCNSFVFDFNQ